MLNGISGAIFDLDGTIIDSMWVWHKIDVDFLKIRNFTLPPDLIDNIQHLSLISCARYFKERFYLADSIDEIMDEWNNMAYKEYENNIVLKPGVMEYLSYLRSKKIKLAIATSNSQLLLEVVLRRLGIYDYFQSITLSSEVQRDKNFPDIYLLAAKKLGVNPSECMVFEDILPAVKGAKAAGMKVIGVFDLFSKHQKQEMMRFADYYIQTYSELNVNTF